MSSESCEGCGKDVTNDPGVDVCVECWAHAVTTYAPRELRALMAEAVRYASQPATVAADRDKLGQAARAYAVAAQDAELVERCRAWLEDQMGWKTPSPTELAAFVQQERAADRSPA